MTRRKSRTWPWVVGVVLGLVGVVFLIGPRLVPVGAIRDRAVVAVREATGRELAIDGGVTLSLFPMLAVTAKDVSLSNAPWAGDTPMLRMARLDLRLKLWPLLRGRVEIASFLLDHPAVDLRTDREGHGNWRFAEAKPAAEAPAGGGLPAALSLGDVQVAGGTLLYTDGATGRSEEVDDIALKVGLPSLDQPLAVGGSARWHDRTLDLTFTAAEPRALLGDAGSPVGFQLASEAAKVDFNGKVALAGGAKGEGDLDVVVPSLRGLAAWAAGAPPDWPGTGFGPFEMKSHAVVEGRQVRLGDLRASLDAVKAAGEMTLDGNGPRPAATGRLVVERLDLNPYLPPEEAGKPKEAAWSEAPIDASGLKAADLDLALSAGSVAARKLEVGQTKLTLVLRDGRLTIELSEMALYQGNAQGRVVIDGSAPAPAAEASLRLDGLQAEPLLTALADTGRVTGVVAAETSLTSHGTSQREMVGALDGRGKLTVTDGTIKGLDIVAMLHNAAEAFSGGGGDRTVFSELGGSYVIANGIVRNDDLALLVPPLRVSGAGTVDLPRKQVDYRLEPKLAATAPGAKEAGNLLVPVIVSGPWDNLSYRPDLEAVLKRQAAEPGKPLGDMAGKLRGKLLPKLLGH